MKGLYSEDVQVSPQMLKDWTEIQTRRLNQLFVTSKMVSTHT